MMLDFYQTPFGNYIYDARVNRFACVEWDLFAALKKDDLIFLKKSNTFAQMVKEGFFNRMNFELCKLDVDLYQIMYSRALRSITLQITQNCNLRCAYCPYTENNGDDRLHSNKKMTRQTAYSAINYLQEHSIDSEVLVVGFYGGEPLLEFDLIKEVVEYTEKRFIGKQVIFSITTNATLLDEKKLSFFNKHNVMLMVSLDGPQKVNDKNRVFSSNNRGSFQIVMEKLNLIAEKYPYLKKKTTINMVVDPSQNYDEYLNFINGDKTISKFRIQTQLVDTSELKKSFTPTDDFIMNYRYHEFMNVMRRLNRVNLPPQRDLFSENEQTGDSESYRQLEGGPITSAATPAGPCLPGFIKLFVDVHGNFFPCEKISEKYSILNIGNLQDGIDMKKCVTLIKMPLITQNECKNCFAFRFCDSCYLFGTSKTGLDRCKRLKMCGPVKQHVHELLERYIIEHRYTIRRYV